MLAYLAFHILLLCFVTDHALSKLCPMQNSYEKLDVERIKKLEATWYDVFDTELPTSISNAADCFDRHGIRTMGDGFVVNVTQHFTARPEEAPVEMVFQYIHNGDGTYRFNHTHRYAYTTTTNLSSAFNTTQEELQRDNENSDNLFATNYFLLTDYENYFMSATCIPGKGLRALVKNRRAQPTGQDVLNIWNVFIENGEMPVNKIEFKEACVNRKYLAQSKKEEKLK